MDSKIRCEKCDKYVVKIAYCDQCDIVMCMPCNKSHNSKVTHTKGTKSPKNGISK